MATNYNENILKVLLKELKLKLNNLCHLLCVEYWNYRELSRKVTPIKAALGEIDMEFDIKYIKREPAEDETRESDEQTCSNDQYKKDPMENNEEFEDSGFLTSENNENDFSMECVKEEPPESSNSYQKDDDVNSSAETEYSVQAVAGTSSQNDNMIYFEIPALDSQIKCAMCGAVFTRSREGNEYVCVDCSESEDYQSLSEVDLQKSKLDKSNRPRPYECNFCLKRCVSTSDLTKHRLIHSGDRPFACEICPKKFNQLSNLIRHKSTHSDVKPFQCNICQKKFSQSSYLKKHDLVHSGEKPYECAVCHKRFSDYSTLFKHKLIHSGEKPYGCGICMKSFNQLASLRRHEIIHRDEKPYECKICNKKFAQSHHLKRHQTIHRVIFVDMTSPKFNRKRKVYPNLAKKKRAPELSFCDGEEMTDETPYIDEPVFGVGHVMNQKMDQDTNQNEIVDELDDLDRFDDEINNFDIDSGDETTHETNSENANIQINSKIKCESDCDMFLDDVDSEIDNGFSDRRNNAMKYEIS